MRMPSPSVSGGTRWLPSGETIAVKQPPRSALCKASFGVIEIDLRFGEPSGGVDDEAAALEGVMADRDLDLLGEDRADERARELRNVDLLVVGHEGVARERVVVFPAGKRADAAAAESTALRPEPSPWPQIIRS